MKKTASKTSRPPPIAQYFSKTLLASPMPKWGDDCETIWTAYQRVIDSLKKKVSNISVASERFNKLNEEFLEIYGRTASKEKELKDEGKNPTEGPFYYITVPNNRDQKIFRRLKLRTKDSSKYQW